MARPDPVDTWAPIFTRYFSDAQVIANSISSADRKWCNLCDAPYSGTADAHRSQHERELKEWRKRKRKEGERRSREALAAARREKKLEKRVLGEEDDE